MQPTKELIDALDAEEIAAARRQDPGRKLLAGPQLFDLACMFTEAGIRHDHPDADDEAVHHLLEERLALGARLDESD